VISKKKQSISFTHFQVKNILSAKMDDWNNMPAALILTAQRAPTVQLKEPKLIIQSKCAIICGNNASSSPIGSFDVKTFITHELSSMLANCPPLKMAVIRSVYSFLTSNLLLSAMKCAKILK
jgi:hypothetical protein